MTLLLINTPEYIRDLSTRVDEFDRIALRLLADQIDELERGPSPTFRSQVFHAAERSNKQFGQWMPQRWLEIFIGEMMVEDK